MGALMLGACSDPVSAEAHPRNLFVVSLDTLRADALGAYGNTRGTSPFLDEFAADGVLFENAYSHTPKTAPAHMSLFSGLEPRVHGLGNFGTTGDQKLSKDVITLAQVLKRAGFTNIGVTSGGNVKGVLGFRRGFQAYDDKGRKMEDKLPLMDKWLEEVVDSGERWFGFFHTYQVHDPYLPPDPWRSLYVDPDYDGDVLGDNDELRAQIRAGENLAGEDTKGRDLLYENFWGRVRADDPEDWKALENLYLAQVAWSDFDLGRAMRRWRNRGYFDDAVIAITSDHGEAFGEHGKLQHHEMWKQLLHVPLLVQHPDGRGAGRRVRAHVRHIDFMPSMLDLLGVPDVDVQRSGVSWAGWLLEEPAEDVREVWGEHRSVREAPLDLWSLRTPALSVVHEREGTMVVDRLEDPLELHPVPLAEWDDVQREQAEALLERAHALQLDLAARALDYRRSANGEIDAEMRAELEALGYLQPGE